MPMVAPGSCVDDEEVGYGSRMAAKRPEGVGDESVVDVLEAFERAGWTSNHVARPGGIIVCGQCGTEVSADAVSVDVMHRVEGASDPDDMQIVVGVACPSSGTRGSLVLSYGPKAADVDAELTVALEFPDQPKDPIGSA